MASEHSNFNEISISNLEVAQDIGKNDYFLIQPQSFNNSAKILPFRNMIIGLDNVSFAQTIKTHTNEISANTDAINSLSSTVSAVTSKLGSDIDLLAGLQSYVIVNTVLNCFFPIGSIYTNSDGSDPSDMFFDQYGIETKWSLITDRVLIGAGGKYASGSVGGNEKFEVQLSQENIPIHQHYVAAATVGTANENYVKNGAGLNRSIAGSTYNNDKPQYDLTSVDKTANACGTSPYGQTSPTPIDITPPYFAVYIWQRTK